LEESPKIAGVFSRHWKNVPVDFPTFGKQTGLLSKDWNFLLFGGFICEQLY
jgi:hypothetical protein